LSEAQAVLRLIFENRQAILSAARSSGVDPQHIASIIFQEKLHPTGAMVKNFLFAWPQILVGGQSASIGMAEMDVNTAATLLNIDPRQMDGDTYDRIVEILSDDEQAIHLIGANVSRFEEALGRPITVQEATHGHNVGVEQLIKDLPIVNGTSTSRRSWPYQDAIGRALDGSLFPGE
ncbi:MAG: hypothetical protein R3194_07525, partial [Limnobacter sp.]|nr:hypothetical protein [Limnobacter sp.]